MENKQEKTAAELYREERKQRIAKAAKKNSAKSPQLSKLSRNAGKVVGVLIIVALCLAVIYGCLSFFGIPQKVLTAMKVGDQKITVAKYNYYYMENYLQVYNSTAQYGASYTGYDNSKAPNEQAYSGEIEGIENPTWADVFDYNAQHNIQSYVTYAKLAKEANITVTEEQQNEIDENMKSIKEAAEKNDYSVDRFLARYYGKGCTAKLIEETMVERYLATNYAQAKQDEITASVTDEQINAEFEKNKSTYTKIGFAKFDVLSNAEDLGEDATEEQKNAALEAAKTEAKAKADAYLAGITDAASVLKAAQDYKATNKESSVIYDNASAAQLPDEAAEWALDSQRVVGDKAVFADGDNYLVLLLTSLPAPDSSKGVNVRHILVKFPDNTDENGNPVELSDEQKQTFYAKAQELYNKYLENPTEENFAQLANENTEDTGSAENGGLYESVYPGQMVTEFNDWIFDESRKPGDTGIIETTYGYHIMYFVNNDGAEKWYNDCKNAVADAAIDEFNESITKGTENAIVAKPAIIKWAKNYMEKTISNQQATSSANK